VAKFFLSVGALAGLLAVAFGAFGAHALRGRLDDYARGIFETAVQYHFYHALALVLVGVILHSQSATQPASTLLKSSGWLFLLGTAVFSGSLYLLAITGTKWLGAVTPLGGLALVTGWGCLAAAAWKLLP